MINDLLTQLRLIDKNPGACGGPHDWSHTTSLGTIISLNPTTGKVLAEIYRASKEDYLHLLHQAKEAQQKWREWPAPKRGQLIRDLGGALRQHKKGLGTLISLESGKSIQEGLGEIQEMIDMADFAVGLSRMLYGKTMPSERPEHRLYEQWHPLGVVSVITAFNFPGAVWSWNAFLAAVCGNTVIWKPSPKTSLTALAIQHICNDILTPHALNGLFSLLITDDHVLVNQMVSDDNIALVSFTGSSAVGREINRMVTGRFGKVLLELSGNNAVIVDETANLNLAVPAIIFGALGTSGQRCTSIRRVIMQEKIADQLTTDLIHAYEKVCIGDPLDEKNLLGPLIDKQAVLHFEKVMSAIVEQGGKILYGGTALQGPGFFVQPTLVDIAASAPIVQQETFAPILYLHRYQSFEEALHIQNHSLYGLSSALFSEYLPHIEAFLSHAGSDCGIACINQSTSGAEIGGAFGGEKATGGGREAGSDAWQAYMRRQTVTINWGNSLPLAQGIKF